MMEDVEIEEVLSLANERHLRFNLRKDGRRFVGLRWKDDLGKQVHGGGPGQNPHSRWM